MTVSCELLQTHLVSYRLLLTPVCEQDPKAFPCALSRRDDKSHSKHEYNPDALQHRQVSQQISCGGTNSCLLPFNPLDTTSH